jgi:LuxR family maltose regulon positive regulatory protein
VVNQLPAQVCSFLLQTSPLERLCADLCEAVIGLSGAQQMLEQLERDNLFVEALDDERTWFRYHRLFADFLRSELNRQPPEVVAERHVRAARWYLAHDMPDQAFEHAVSGSDIEMVVQIVDHYLNLKLRAGEIRFVERWANSLPVEWLAAYPVLGLARAGWLSFTGAFEAYLSCVNDVEQRLAGMGGERARWPLARVSAVRCYVACIQNSVEQAEAYAERALRELPVDLVISPQTVKKHSQNIYGKLGAGNRTEAAAEARDLGLLNELHNPQQTCRPRKLHILGNTPTSYPCWGMSIPWC